jgi:putative DNA primase/helicase
METSLMDYNEFVSLLRDKRETPSGWQARCPAHEDRKASLSISRGDDGRVLLHCHAGCTPEAIVQALGLKMSDLMPDSNGKQPKRRIVATYDYHDEQGELLFQVCRFEPKDFRQRKPDGKGGWSWSVKGVRQVPFNLPAIVKDSKRIVCVVEGEKDVQSLERIDVLATCNAGGASKWRESHARCLKGCKVVVLPDNDEPGRKHAQQVAQSLQGVAEWVKVVQLTGLPEKGDVSDWIASGGTKAQLLELINDTPEWSPDQVEPEPWPDFEPLDNRDLPRFPVEALPDVLRDWVTAESHATQTPPDLSALLSLAVCSTAIARRVDVVPRRGWREPTNLFVAVLLEPGNRKSAVFSDCVRPLREVESERIEYARPAVARAQSERRRMNRS